MAAFALGLAGDRTAVDRLLAALADSDAGVRGRAAEALGRIGDPRAAAAIARLVVDALPKTISRMTVRGDDPGQPRRHLGGAAPRPLRPRPPQGRPRRPPRPPRRRPPALRLVGGDVGGDAPREPGAPAGPRRRRRLGRPPLARARRPGPRRARRTPPRSTSCCPSSATPTRRWRSTRCARSARSATRAGDGGGGGACSPPRATSCAARPCAPSPSSRRTPRCASGSWGSSRSATPGSAPPRSLPSPTPIARTSPSCCRGWTPTPSGGCAPRSPRPSAASATR